MLVRCEFQQQRLVAGDVAVCRFDGSTGFEPQNDRISQPFGRREINGRSANDNLSIRVHRDARRGKTRKVVKRDACNTTASEDPVEISFVAVKAEHGMKIHRDQSIGRRQRQIRNRAAAFSGSTAPTATIFPSLCTATS